MAATLVATAGAPDANSYVTAEQAAAMMEERAVSDAWLDASPDEQVRALISATRRLDVERWKGSRTDAAQALQWPRTFAPDPDASFVDALSAATSEVYGYYASDAIPARIQRAQVELAYQILAGNVSADDTGLEGFESVKVGALQVTPNHQRRAGTLPQSVRREIAPLLAGGGNTVRLARG